MTRMVNYVAERGGDLEVDVQPLVMCAGDAEVLRRRGRPRRNRRPQVDM